MDVTEIQKILCLLLNMFETIFKWLYLGATLEIHIPDCFRTFQSKTDFS